MASGSPTWVVLAGGRGSRMGGSKVELELDGRRLIDHVVDAIPDGDPVIVVGPELELARPVRFCIEEPRYGGPAAALAAALPLIDTARFVLLAVDMPRAVPLALDLCRLDRDADVVVLLDAAGRRQPMCSCWRTESARSAMQGMGSIDGAPLHRLMASMSVAEVPAGEPARLADIDTPADLRAARVIRGGAPQDT